MQKHILEKPAAPTIYNPELTPEFSDLVLKCLAKKRDELLLALQKAHPGETVTVEIAEDAQIGGQRLIVRLGHSGTVREALLHAQRSGLGPRTLVGESRPLLEGRTLATELAAADIPVWLVVDAALPLLLVFQLTDRLPDPGIVEWFCQPTPAQTRQV